MKTLYFFAFSLLSSLLFCQEFKTYENGLIYSPYAMEKLKGMVGEKNEEFRICELNKRYGSFEQTKGRVFTLNCPDIKILKEELKKNISLPDFIKKYVDPNEEKLRLLTKNHYKNYKDVQVIGIREQPNGSRFEIAESLWEGSRSEHWVWNFSDNKYVDVVYFEKDFRSREIPERYARMIQYSECLIDTTSQIFETDANRKQWYVTDNESKKKQNTFLDYITSKFGKKLPSHIPDLDMSEAEMNALIDSLNSWEKSKEIFVEEVLSKEDRFHDLLNEAYGEALSKKSSDDKFEYYVAKYLSPKKALKLKRNRIVIGQCSMDDSPRVHAMNIAQLAGESLNWDIFLRAHLNVLNDNVSRVSDGSWAWEGRQTYIKELEELNINVFDLVFGIALRAKNVADGHYFGSIGRLGRAIAESKESSTFEFELPNIISDENLDDYNRLLMFYLYDNLVYYSDTDKSKSTYRKSHAEVSALLPDYIEILKD